MQYNAVIVIMRAVLLHVLFWKNSRRKNEFGSDKGCFPSSKIKCGYITREYYQSLWCSLPSSWKIKESNVMVFKNLEFNLTQSYTKRNYLLFDWPICCHWSLSIPPEDNRKSEVFWCFQGAEKTPVVRNGLADEYLRQSKLEGSGR